MTALARRPQSRIRKRSRLSLRGKHVAGVARVAPVRRAQVPIVTIDRVALPGSKLPFG
ncbi:hypothetical protein L810_5283 [Burkholderia sp. AU4i]|nr:hypothetical protein L810_5283 [Burkholderia sp. AU4i]